MLFRFLMMSMVIHLDLILWHPHRDAHRVIPNRSLFTLRICCLFVILENSTAVLGNSGKILLELGYRTYVFQRARHCSGILFYRAFRLPAQIFQGLRQGRHEGIGGVGGKFVCGERGLSWYRSVPGLIRC